MLLSCLSEVLMREPLRKITVNVPEQLLISAQQATRRGTTETVVEGLRELEKREKRSALRRLRGKVVFDLKLEKTRK